MHVVLVPLPALRPHPLNPRGSELEVASLAASIERHGLLQPLVVKPLLQEGSADPLGKYVILAGHRRAEALRSLGRATAECHIVEGDEAAALEVLLAETIHHEQVDPLREAACVESLLTLSGWKVGEVADHLGKTARWVAQRRAMAGLSPAVVEAYSKGALEGFTPAMLATLSALAPEAQDALIFDGGEGAWTQDEVERLVGEGLRALGSAPWDLHDATLAPKAGACSGCPKTSVACPGLFDDGATEQAGDLRKATCRDGGCWTAKRAAHISARRQALAKQHADLVLVSGPNAWQERGTAIPVGTLGEHEYKPAKGKKSSSAVPALVVAGTGAGSLIYVDRDSLPKQKAASSAAAKRERGPESGARAVKKPPTTEERVEALERRRRAVVVENVREQILNRLETPGFTMVTGMLYVYGCDSLELAQLDTDGGGRGSAALPERQACWKAMKTPERAVVWSKAVWPGVRAQIVAHLQFYNPDSVDSIYAEAVWLCEVFAIDLAAHRTMAEASIPTPAVLAKALGGPETAPEVRPAGRKGRPGKRGGAPVQAPKGRARTARSGKAAAAGDDSSED